MKKDEFKCIQISGTNVCLNKNGKNPFDNSKELNIILRENTESNFDFMNKCGNKGLSCISNNLRNTFHYIAIFLISTIIINFFHELTHFLILLIGGENPTGFEFGINGGLTYANLPDIASHSIIWWYFLLFGPLLLVNMSSIIITYYLYTIDTSDKIFNQELSIKNRFVEIFLRSTCYASALIIIMNTVLSPLLELVYDSLEIESESDFIIAWRLSLDLSTEVYPDSQYYAIIMIVLIGFSIILINNKNIEVKKIGIILIIFSILSMCFFIYGISDKILFQWLCISSVIFMNIFAWIYFMGYGKKIH